ncbi:hypothetical protein CDD81_7437 [Ophiocordyceps australis]|uniref:Alpha/beta hydrolase fold-3 domain-containing protein n=1 Tax=Ophiocordyceps australis TaxID=1399860 RepID=A0A2C5YGG0_9HYPO|nr:hypothetical protein CDD81_7437 [Ophiocordyceps australis]
MTDAAKIGLSVGETGSLVFTLLFVAPARLLAYWVTYTWFALRHRLKLRFYLTCAVARVLLTSFSGRQIQALLPSTRQTYEAWMRNQGLEARVEPLAVEAAPESALLWIGDKQRATTAVLFFHGGGYVVPASRGHLELCWRAFVQPSQGRVAVGLLQYSLSPGAKFPVQLRQAAAGLGALLDAGFSPRNIVFGGDSAGGNMALQLMSHLLHPVDAAARRFSLAEPLAGVFLVSPANDMLSASMVSRLGLEHFGPHTENLAAIGPFTPQWFQDLHHMLAKLDPALDVRVDLPDDEAHDFILVEGINRTTGPATRRMSDWLSSLRTLAAARP